MLILMLFDIGQFPSFWLCYLDLPLGFKLFQRFSSFKHFSTLPHIIASYHSLKFVWPIQTLWADFLSKLGGFCWDCLVKRYELSSNLFIILLLYLLLSLFCYTMFAIGILRFCKFYIYICCKLFLEIWIIIQLTHSKTILAW